VEGFALNVFLLGALYGGAILFLATLVILFFFSGRAAHRANGELKKNVAHLTQELQNKQKPYVIGLTDEQIDRLALQINNIRDSHTVHEA
jgi:hypothetical protein